MKMSEILDISFFIDEGIFTIEDWNGTEMFYHPYNKKFYKIFKIMWDGRLVNLEVIEIGD